MTTIELQLDAQTIERARRAAQARSHTLEEIVTTFVEQLSIEQINDPLFGLFADEPELVDRVEEDIMQTRQLSFLRVGDG